MVKRKQIFKENAVNEDSIRDINFTTKLPALREVIKWFEKSFTMENIRDYLSVTIYEIPKYAYVLDNFGIEAVDYMLKGVTHILQQIWEKDSYIGHISDDRFVIISQYDVTENTESIMGLLEEEHKLLEREVEKYNATDKYGNMIELNYGYIVQEPGQNEKFEYLFKLANSEMLLNRLQKELSLSNSSRTVLWKHQEVFHLLMEKNLFFYHFQPIVDARNGKIFGYEALMRTEPVINMSPIEVLDVATKLGKLYDVERATMSNVMDYFLQNHDFFEEKRLFVNSIPAYMLSSVDWDMLVEKYGNLMDKLVVEMTEQTEMDDEHLAKFRNRLKMHHISLAIDDYGTGFSNLSNLIRYSPNYVKIDRTLIKDIQENPKIQRLAEGIIEFIHENGYAALAEGVETFDELKTMIGMNIDYVQGFYLARPNKEIIKEIDKKQQEEIITLNIMRSEYSIKVYNPSENETVNLAQLVMQNYNSILIEQENVVIEGVLGTPVGCSIMVKDGVNTNITLRNISITTKKEMPLIEIGQRSCVKMIIEGANEIVNRGIRVPQGSSVTLTGNGSLYIHCEMLNSYGIGGDKVSSYGDISIVNLPQLIIDSNGENCIGIGGGKNPANSKIHIVKSGIKIECSGGNSIGIGDFEGNSYVEGKNCDLEFSMSCANAVGIGALKGNTDILLDNYRLNVVESGNSLCGIGVLGNGEGNIHVSNGTIECDIRGRNIVCVGSDYGHLDCEVENSNTIFYCEGSSVVGIGDMNGRGKVKIKEANLNMSIHAKDILDIGSKNGRLEVVDSKRNIRINE